MGKFYWSALKATDDLDGKSAAENPPNEFD